MNFPLPVCTQLRPPLPDKDDSRKTTRNACSILTAIGKADSIPVYMGAAKALHRPAMHAPTDIHGDTGLDGTDLLPEPAVAARTEPAAIDAAYAALRACRPGTAWVVATGAFTNAAALFAKYPDLVAHVRGLSLMGGAVGGGFTPAVLGEVAGVPRVGNWTQFAEFNVLADPEAAASIFANRALAAKTTLIPLDVTHLVLTTAEVRDLLLYGREAVESRKRGEAAAVAAAVERREGKSKLRTMLVELLMFFAKTYRCVCFLFFFSFFLFFFVFPRIKLTTTRHRRRRLRRRRRRTNAPPSPPKKNNKQRRIRHHRGSTAARPARSRRGADGRRRPARDTLLRERPARRGVRAGVVGVAAGALRGECRDRGHVRGRAGGPHADRPDHGAPAAARRGGRAHPAQRRRRAVLEGPRGVRLAGRGRRRCW